MTEFEAYLQFALVFLAAYLWNRLDRTEVRPSGPDYARIAELERELGMDRDEEVPE